MAEGSKPGVLILLVGNSGSGKDTLLQWAIDHWPAGLPPLHVPRRVITRPPSPETEDYDAVSPEDFKDRQVQGQFALTWRSYDIDYGIPKSIEDYLKKGLPVVVNVSRQIIEDTRAHYPSVKVIFVHVPFETLVGRLKTRGRESETDVERRLLRAEVNENLPGADFVVENVSDVEMGGKQLLDALVKSINGA